MQTTNKHNQNTQWGDGLLGDAGTRGVTVATNGLLAWPGNRRRKSVAPCPPGIAERLMPVSACKVERTHGDGWRARSRMTLAFELLASANRGGETTYKNNQNTQWVAARGHLPVTQWYTQPATRPARQTSCNCSTCVSRFGAAKAAQPHHASPVGTTAAFREAASVSSACGRALVRVSVYSYPLPPLTMTSAKENTSPIAAFRMKGVSVAVYGNQIKGQPVPLFKVSIKKNVFDKGEFKSVSSLGRDDLPVARHLLEQAWLKIIDLEAEARKESPDSSDDDSSEE